PMSLAWNSPMVTKASATMVEIDAFEMDDDRAYVVAARETLAPELTGRHENANCHASPDGGATLRRPAPQRSTRTPASWTPRAPRAIEVWASAGARRRDQPTP